MAQEINVSLFEKNLMLFNKKSLKRRYASILDHQNEYLRQKPLGISDKLVLEAVIDKDYVEAFQALLKEEGFEILGSKNFYHIEKIVSDYNESPELYAAKKDMLEAIERDYQALVAEKKDYEEIQDGDCAFAFLPYNDSITNLCEFIENEKTKISEFCTKNDITIVLNVKGFASTLSGFIGFNFFDADAEGKEECIDFATNFVVNVDYNDGPTVYNAAVLLTALTPNPEDLELINAHIVAENLRIAK